MALCRERIHAATRHDDLFQVEVEIHFFLVALIRFYKAIKLGARFLPTQASLHDRVNHFNTYIGIKRTMRNVGEHFDDYLSGNGYDHAVDSRALQVWSLDASNDDVRFSWLGETFDLEKTMKETAILWDQFKLAFGSYERA